MAHARAIVLVIDSGGVGAAPDVASFGDSPNANTIGNTAKAAGGIALPTFEALGLGCITNIPGGLTGGIRAFPSNSRRRMAFSLAGTELGGGNPDGAVPQRPGEPEQP